MHSAAADGDLGTPDSVDGVAVKVNTQVSDMIATKRERDKLLLSIKKYQIRINLICFSIQKSVANSSSLIKLVLTDDGKWPWPWPAGIILTWGTM